MLGSREAARFSKIGQHPIGFGKKARPTEGGGQPGEILHVLHADALSSLGRKDFPVIGFGRPQGGRRFSAAAEPDQGVGVFPIAVPLVLRAVYLRIDDRKGFGKLSAFHPGPGNLQHDGVVQGVIENPGHHLLGLVQTGKIGGVVISEAPGVAAGIRPALRRQQRGLHADHRGVEFGQAPNDRIGFKDNGFG